VTGTAGIIVEGTGGVWRVRTADGEERDASLAGRLKQEMKGHLKLAVGDHVLVEPDERDSGWRICTIEPRTAFSRAAVGGATASACSRRTSTRCSSSSRSPSPSRTSA
jgi:translation initiation factor IF-1